MPYIDIKIAWNWGTSEQRAKLIEQAARMVADVLEKESIDKSIIVNKIDGDGHEMPGNESS